MIGSNFLMRAEGHCAYSFGGSESSEFQKRQTLESSTASNQKNENSEKRRARNEGSFH